VSESLDKAVMVAIRGLYADDENARKLFDWLASRERDVEQSTVDRVSAKLRISRGEAVALLKQLTEARCGEFVIGRRGHPSRIIWWYSCISLGRAASGEQQSLEVKEDPVLEDDEEPSAFVKELAMTDLKGLTIVEAKQLLSASLGVPVSSIEITIRV